MQGWEDPPPANHPSQGLSVARVGRMARRAATKPSPPRLLTEEEYRAQGEAETRRALEELRSYCNSPDFSAWTVVSRIQSPKRYPPPPPPRASCTPFPSMEVPPQLLVSAWAA